MDDKRIAFNIFIRVESIKSIFDQQKYKAPKKIRLIFIKFSSSVTRIQTTLCQHGMCQ